MPQAHRSAKTFAVPGETARIGGGRPFRRLLVLILLLALVGPAQGLDPVVDSVMYHDPALTEASQARSFSERLKPLWLEALARPEADYQRQAALSIALAHRLGMKGLETTVVPLTQALARPDQDPGARLAIVRALLMLDARQAAPQLFQLAEAGDSALRDLIEPALAGWDYRPARAVWLERLGQAGPVGGGLLLAMRGLGVVGEEKAVPRLRELSHSRGAAAPVRLAAARALGNVRRAGSEKDARSLAAESSPEGVVAHLAAAALLRYHAGDEAVRLLQQLAADDEPAVIAAALERLIEIDPKLVLPVLAHALPSPDPRVQLYVVEVLARLPTADHIRLLGDRLDHPHPEVRVRARHCLRELAAKAENRAAVLGQGTRLLAAAGWRGQEQAAILLALLDHKPAGGRLVELLSASRPEVEVTAAWALRRLANAQILPAVLAYVRRRYDQLLGPDRRNLYVNVIDQQLSHLVQFLGQSRYRPAEALLMQLLPRFLDSGERNPAGPETRAAAAWALGLLHEGKRVPRLAEILEARLADVGGPMREPEDPRVRRMAAVALGLMKARPELGTLRAFYMFKKPTLNMVNNACGWAIEQITGEKGPPPGIMEFSPSRWFLSPYEPKDRPGS